MALSPLQSGRRDAGDEGAKDPQRKAPWVSWIAIALGVTMTGIGAIMLLWGLSWQSYVGDRETIEGDDLKGGAFVLPFGVMLIAFGIMWIYNGTHGFRKKEPKEDLRKCPECGRMVETDVDFCYYCANRFQPEKGADEGGEEEGGSASKRSERTARPLSKEELR